MILVDSDVIIDSLSGRTLAIRMLHDLEAGGLAVSTITIAEVFEGVYGSPGHGDRLAPYLRYFSTYTSLNVTEEVAYRFAELRALLRRQGNVIADMDLLIAATTLVHDLTLLTGNERHFSRVPGLRLHQAAG